MDPIEAASECERLSETTIEFLCWRDHASRRIDQVEGLALCCCAFSFLVCPISASHLSLSQESGTARPVAKAASLTRQATYTGPCAWLWRVRLHHGAEGTGDCRGANPIANLDNAKIVRKDVNGPTEVLVYIRKIMEAKART